MVTLWTYYESATYQEVPPADYALHAGLRELTVPAPHFGDRVGQARRLVVGHGSTPTLADADREFLGSTSEGLSRAIGQRGGAEQLQHGEPHPATCSPRRTGCC